MKGHQRKEMQAIRDIIAAADDPTLNKAKRKVILTDVEDQLIAMQRLWDPGSGVYKRRQAEANLWRTGVNAW